MVLVLRDEKINEKEEGGTSILTNDVIYFLMAAFNYLFSRVLTLCSTRNVLL